MNYRIIFDNRAERFIRKQPPNEQRRILAAIYKLPDEGDIKAMRGHKGLYRLRVGDYRILYTVDHDVLIVRIVDAGNRGDIYK